MCVSVQQSQMCSRDTKRLLRGLSHFDEHKSKVHLYDKVVPFHECGCEIEATSH